MTDQRAPSPVKWPFFLADIVLLGVAFWIVNHYPAPVPVAALALGVGCVVIAAFIAVMPFRLQYQAVVQFAESNGLVDAVAQINKAETAAEQIRAATAQWQGVQEQSARTVAAVREISDRMTAEAKAFAEFMQKANEHEKATLRLEVEKFRRSEGQWLQLIIHLLDHTYALHQAGARSGQPNLEAQLGRFREACYDAVRRVGLAPYQPVPGDVFDSEKHQLVEGQVEPEAGALIGETLAVGYSFQGQLVRRSLVSLQVTEPEPAPVPVEPQAEPAPITQEPEPSMSDEVAGAPVTPVETTSLPTDEPPPIVRGKISEGGEPFRLES